MRYGGFKLTENTEPRVEKNESEMLNRERFHPLLNGAESNPVWVAARNVFQKRTELATPWEVRIPAEELRAITPVLAEFLTAVTEVEKNSPEKVLMRKFGEMLPMYSPKELQKMTGEIVAAVHKNQELRQSLQEAVGRGETREKWFGGQVQHVMEGMTVNETVLPYLKNMEKAIDNANRSLEQVIKTKSNEVNMNPRLHGYLAEELHAQTFNLKMAAMERNDYYAEVLKPKPGETYRKNSVDVQIRRTQDQSVASRYQSKYGKDAQATEALFRKGDYRGQQKLTPADQEITVKHTSAIEAPDGTRSREITYADVKRIQNDAQSGEFQGLGREWLPMNEVCKKLCEKTVMAGLLAFVAGTVIDLGEQAISGEDFRLKEALKEGAVWGSDAAAKTLLSGALMACAKLDKFSFLSKEISADVCTGIACVAFDDLKIAFQIANGKLPVQDGVIKIGETTVISGAGVLAARKGAEIGITVGAVGGVPGEIAGIVIGGLVGGYIGSKAGELAVDGTHKLYEGICERLDKPVKSVPVT